jgi:hypothetical protein
MKIYALPYENLAARLRNFSPSNNAPKKRPLPRKNIPHTAPSIPAGADLQSAPVSPIIRRRLQARAGAKKSFLHPVFFYGASPLPVVGRSGYPLQVLARLRLVAGYPLLSSRVAPLKGSRFAPRSAPQRRRKGDAKHCVSTVRPA